MTTNGIRIGNLLYKTDEILILKQKSSIIKWNVIKSLKMVSKGYYGGIYGGRDFYHIHLKTKSKKIYDCLIYNPQGFIQALKKLNKYHLLSKDSRYR